MNNIHKLQNIFVAKSEHYHEYSEAQQKNPKNMYISICGMKNKPRTLRIYAYMYI